MESYRNYCSAQFKVSGMNCHNIRYYADSIFYKRNSVLMKLNEARVFGIEAYIRGNLMLNFQQSNMRVL